MLCFYPCPTFASPPPSPRPAAGEHRSAVRWCAPAAYSRAPFTSQSPIAATSPPFSTFGSPPCLPQSPPSSPTPPAATSPPPPLTSMPPPSLRPFLLPLFYSFSPLKRRRIPPLFSLRAVPPAPPSYRNRCAPVAPQLLPVLLSPQCLPPSAAFTCSFRARSRLLHCSSPSSASPRATTHHRAPPPSSAPPPNPQAPPPLLPSSILPAAAFRFLCTAGVSTDFSTDLRRLYTNCNHILRILCSIDTDGNFDPLLPLLLFWCFIFI